MGAMKEWQESSKWVNNGWKGEREMVNKNYKTNEIQKDGRESSENCKYGDKSFCLWLSQNYPLLYGEYRAKFFLDVGGLNTNVK